MLVKVRFPSEKEVKWKQESNAVEGGRVWVAFIGPEQRIDVEARKWFGGQQQLVLQCISYKSGGELGGGKEWGGPLLEGEAEASLFRW
jgi:hypothetical protein